MHGGGGVAATGRVGGGASCWRGVSRATRLRLLAAAVGALLFFTARPCLAASEPGSSGGSSWGRHRLATSGFYPIWEDTGSLLEPADIQLASNGFRVRIPGDVQLGLQPTYYLHRAPNLEAKVSILKRAELQLALRQSVIVLFRNAQDRMITPVYASRLTNPNSNVVLAPASLHATWRPFSFLLVHGSATVLPMLSNEKDFENRAVGGLSAMVELPVVRGHSLLLHGGEVGLWDHDFAYLGASYRLNYAWFMMQLGFAYRLRPEGAQGSPLLSVGAYL